MPQVDDLGGPEAACAEAGLGGSRGNFVQCSHYAKLNYPVYIYSMNKSYYYIRNKGKNIQIYTPKYILYIYIYLNHFALHLELIIL